MSNRFGRDTSRNQLFSTYDRSASPSKSESHPRPAPGYGFNGYAPSPQRSDPYSCDALAPSFSAYPSNNAPSTFSNAHPSSSSPGGYRPATPNARGQYSSAVLDELESQNEAQVGVLTGKVKMLKELTSAIGDEIRDSTALAEKMNDGFESSRLKIRGTMTRMLRMAEKTGVGWKVWLGFFTAVIVLFWYVWLF